MGHHGCVQERGDDCGYAAIGRCQSYPDIEHIVNDDDSRDVTLLIVNAHRLRLAQVVSELDRGIYDAMNNGLRLATDDVVRFVNSDDYYTHDAAIETIARAFAQRGSTPSSPTPGSSTRIDRPRSSVVIRHAISTQAVSPGDGCLRTLHSIFGEPSMNDMESSGPTSASLVISSSLRTCSGTMTSAIDTFSKSSSPCGPEGSA